MCLCRHPSLGAICFGNAGGLSMTVGDEVVKSDVLAILRCPACMHDYTEAAERLRRGKLTLVSQARLVCQDCGRRYPIVDGIPHMVVEEAEMAPATPA
jgi:uncharacterized protein